MRNPSPTRALALSLLAAGCALTLAACSSSSSSSTTTSGQGGSTTTAAPASTASFTCAKAPASAVNAALGTSVGAPTTQTNGSVTVCTYNSTSPIQSVIIRVDTGSSAATFAAEQSQSAAHGETTTPMSGVGDAAYSLTISGGGFTTNTFAVLKGTNEVQVNGPGTPAQVQAYATQLVDSL
jgi:hypothetical protein